MEKWTILTPISAICLGLIMIPVAYIHNKRKEIKNVIINIFIFTICCIIAYYRIKKSRKVTVHMKEACPIKTKGSLVLKDFKHPKKNGTENRCK